MSTGEWRQDMEKRYEEQATLQTQGQVAGEAAEETVEQAATEVCDCCHKTKERSEKEYKDLLHRLNRIEGQIRGIKSMLERDAYCTDILMQVSAANAALNSFSKVLLANHIKGCVTRDILDGREDTVDELVVTLQKLMR